MAHSCWRKEEGGPQKLLALCISQTALVSKVVQLKVRNEILGAESERWEQRIAGLPSCVIILSKKRFIIMGRIVHVVYTKTNLKPTNCVFNTTEGRPIRIRVFQFRGMI